MIRDSPITLGLLRHRAGILFAILPVLALDPRFMENGESFAYLFNSRAFTISTSVTYSLSFFGAWINHNSEQYGKISTIT